MAFKDEILRCAACGRNFVYTVREQRARLEQGLGSEAPVFCLDCRSADVRLAEAERAERVDPAGDEPRELRAAGGPRRDGARTGPDSRSRVGSGQGGGGPRGPGGPPRSNSGGNRGRPDGRPAQARTGARPPSAARGGGGRAPGDGRDGRRRDGDGRDRRGSGGGGGGGRRPGGRDRGASVRTRQTELRIRHLGTVKWFDEDRGFGFIAQDDGDELFVHSTAVLLEEHRHLREGQPVEYEIERTPRGLQAVDVVPLAW